MGFFDRLFGRTPRPSYGQSSYGQGSAQRGQQPYSPQNYPQRQPSQDEQAVARYKYLLRTASPEQLEQVHAEAFAKLTPQQRQQLLTELSQTLPAGEQVRSDSPQDLARAATRAEMRQPGYLQNTFSRASFGGMGGMGMGMGGTIMGSMMGTIGGVIIGTAIADMLFDGFDHSPEAAAIGEGDYSGDTGSYDDGGNFNDDAQLDASQVESGDGGWGVGDTGDSGWGSGDFGGGDFGGGDFGGDFGGGDF